MSSKMRRCVLLAAAIVAAITTSVALAAMQQTYSQKFTTKHPGVSTGMTFAATARDTTGAPPVQARTVVLTFPAGTRVNPGALPKCVNRAACPSKSKIGVGTATAAFLKSSTNLSVVAYNRAGGMVLVVSNPLGAPIVLNPVLSGRKLTIQVPSLKFNGEAIILTHLALTVNRLGAGAKAYAKTPTSCPKGGAWTFGALFTYVDSTTKSLSSPSPCSKH